MIQRFPCIYTLHVLPAQGTVVIQPRESLHVRFLGGENRGWVHSRTGCRLTAYYILYSTAMSRCIHPRGLYLSRGSVNTHGFALMSRMREGVAGLVSHKLFYCFTSPSISGVGLGVNSGRLQIMRIHNFARAAHMLGSVVVSEAATSCMNAYYEQTTLTTRLGRDCAPDAACTLPAVCSLASAFHLLPIPSTRKT